MVRDTIANNIRLLRAERKISQTQLALQAGLSQAYIGKIEKGRGNVTVNVLDALSRALNVTPARLVTQILID
ncbi:MAG: helix-turn-helix domain-containing protein [Gammaproteobacteria bacterium SHHR-1]